ncbi:prepilin-type N-terminal cleavage/methylation domain-containing protein [Synechococcus sp. W60.3]|uniref:prepilin-type N-terminal cleavage/methylation domain-containing protein n=2 Tax=unclassified Synechococcus TaxID=2626047 RepID=UPI0039C6AF19
MNKWRLWRQQETGGFTLIEVLASVVIVALAMAALAPALTLIAYRRAMSERVELANRLAQEEVDRIRTLVDIELAANPRAFQDPAQLARLPKVGANPLANTPPPTNMDTEGNNYSIRVARVQVPGRNPEEYVIQTFRDAGAPCIDRRERRVIQGVPCSFHMGVRVYHRFSFDPNTRRALPGLRAEVVSANQNLANANVWLFPLATSLVEVNPAANLGDVCRAVLADVQARGGTPTNNCNAFPLPSPSPTSL